MSETETVRAELYMHGPVTFAFLVPEPPLDLFGLAEINRRTQTVSQDPQQYGEFGTVWMRTIDDPERLDVQVLAVLTTGDAIRPDMFEMLITNLFAERSIATTWHTDIHDIKLQGALVARHMLIEIY